MNEPRHTWPRDQRLWAIFHEFWQLAGDGPKVPPAKLAIEDMENEAKRIASLIKTRRDKEDAIYRARWEAMKKMEGYIRFVVKDKDDPEFIKLRSFFNDTMDRHVGPPPEGAGKRPLPGVVN